MGGFILISSFDSLQVCREPRMKRKFLVSLKDALSFIDLTQTTTWGKKKNKKLGSGHVSTVMLSSQQCFDFFISTIFLFYRFKKNVLSHFHKQRREGSTKRKHLCAKKQDSRLRCVMIKPRHRYSQPKPPTDSGFRVAVVSCTTNPIFNSLMQSPYCLPNYTQQTEWIQTSQESQFISGRHVRKIITFPMRAVFICYVLFHCAFGINTHSRTWTRRKTEAGRIGSPLAHRFQT